MLYPPKAFVLGFLFRAPAKDAVRGFCATFATKSSKDFLCFREMFSNFVETLNIFAYET